MSEATRRGRTRGHKDQQLCRQVADAIAWFLADVDDPRLAALTVAGAMPAPDATRVVVTLAGAEAVDAGEAQAALAEYADELREEVAAEIHRKRVPALAFRVVAAAELVESRDATA